MQLNRSTEEDVQQMRAGWVWNLEKLPVSKLLAMAEAAQESGDRPTLLSLISAIYAACDNAECRR